MGPSPVMQAPGEQGLTPSDPQHAEQLQQDGYYKCLNPTCDFHFSPERMESHGREDTIDCPGCKFSYNMLDTAPFSKDAAPHGAYFKPGGATIVGISLKEQGQIGEEIVQKLGEIPGYGPLTWWSPDYHQPLDGGTKDWGIECKTMNSNAKALYFSGGGKTEVAAKNAQAREMGYQGILGVLVVLDFKRSVADIYVREMPFSGWGSKNTQGVGYFQHHTAPHLVKEVPFNNPMLDPASRQPQVHNPDMPF